MHSLYNISDEASFESSHNELRIQTIGQFCEGKISWRNNDETSPTVAIRVATEQLVKLVFSLVYLNQIGKTTLLSSFVEVFMKNDFPLMLQFPVNEDQGVYRFFIAPKLNEDGTN